MNDADFEMLARESGGAFDAWLRSAAVGHAIAYNQRSLCPEHVIENARKFFEYIKGESSEPNLHGQKQDER
jgi:hypothetical protein